MMKLNGKTLKMYAAIVTAGATLMLANGVAVTVFDEGVPVTHEKSAAPRLLAEVQPADVACKADVVKVSDSSAGPFYRAVWGDFTLSWTKPLDKLVITDKKEVAYPPVSEHPKAVACLEKRAVPAGPAP